MGADDYHAKPFVPSELYARVRAILRGPVRCRRTSKALPPNCGELRFRGLALDIAVRNLIDTDGSRSAVGAGTAC